MIYTKQEWYTPAEVAIHNTASDCWVSLNGKVFDLTKWLESQFRLCTCTKTCSCPVKNWYCSDVCVEYCNCFKRGYFYCDAKRLAMTILAYAGKDVSHWFKGEDWVKYTHPITGSTVPYMPHGHGLRQPVVPSTKWRPIQQPWWQDDGIVVGKATARTRPIRITNTITGSTVTLEVCSEETLYQVMMRYLPHNAHMLSYTWRYLGKPLCYNRTLKQNGILDERDRFSDVALAENVHIPAILIYFNDDLTEGSTVTLEVCSEETLYQVMMRYLPHNAHMLSYTWRYLGKPLCYNHTLEQNGILDERDRFTGVALAENVHIPAILIYYNDDLTEDPPRGNCFCYEHD